MGIFQLIQSIDDRLLDFLRLSMHNPVLDRLMPPLSFLGNWGLIWLAAAAVFLLTKGRRKAGATLLLALLLCTLAGNSLLKPLAARPRPCIVHPEYALLIARPEDFSFPSGHAAASFGAAAVILYSDGKLGVAALVAAALIAFSRLYLYVHYPSDVLAGAALGVLMAGLAISLVNRADKIIRRKRGGFDEQS